MKNHLLHALREQRKSFLLLLFAVMAGTNTLFADYYRVKIDDLIYNLYTSNNTAEVTYKAQNMSIPYDFTTINIPENVVYSGKVYHVTRIGNYAFQRCTALTSIAIPNSVTFIGDKAFSNCTNLSSFTIPEGVTSIGHDVFTNCSSLTSIVVAPENTNFSSVGKILFNKDKTKLILCVNNFQGTYTIPNSVISIGDYAFTNCTGLTSISIPESVKSIGSSAFSYCNSLTSVEIPNSVDSVGNEVFYTTGLTTPVYNEKLFIYMPYIYFSESVDSYTIPDGIETICNGAFSNCEGVRSISMYNSVKRIGDYAFSNCAFLSSLTLSEQLTSIGELAFHGCGYLNTIKLPNSVSYIGRNAFADTPIMDNEDNWHNDALCLGRWLIRLRNVSGEYTIPDSIMCLYNDALSACTFNGLKTITIPESVIRIGDNAFWSGVYEYNNPLTLIFKSVIPPDFMESQIFGQNLPTIYVPCGALENYQDALDKYYLRECVKYAPSPYIITAVAFGKGHVQKDESNVCETKIEAIPDYGYHFTQWNDENTDNPRYIKLTQDTTFAAAFVRNPIVTPTCDSTMGRVYCHAWIDSIPEYEKAYEYFDVYAEPYYGYHFVEWSDGSTEQYRHTIHTSQDATISAIFAKNQYEIKTQPNNPKYGITLGDTIVYHGDSAEIQAIPNYGYYFSYWDPYRTHGYWGDTLKQTAKFDVYESITYTAYFYPMHFNVSCYPESKEKGSVSRSKESKYLDTVTITAQPNYGYHFTHWNDGNTDNPRQFVLTRDTTFVASFGIDISGTCGDNLALKWEYDNKNKSLTISGNGTLNSNYTFGVEAPQNVKKLIIAEGVTTIGNSAFANYSTINHISIPTTIKTIYEQAFYNCTGLEQIFSYREKPSVAYSNTFDGIDKFECTLHVLSASVDMYKAATGWRDFYYIQTIDAEEITEPVEDVIVTPTNTTAEIIWPYIVGAVSYEIAIRDFFGNVICKLTFNASGHLIGIAFAPSRNHQSQSEQTTGFQFTVTSLDSGTPYTYSVEAKDEADQTIDTRSGSFTTTSELPTGIDDVLNLQSDMPKKVMINGQIFILRGEKVYTLQGQKVK